MIISRSKKFIFIHIYKTAGSSITDALKPYADVFISDEIIKKFIGVWGRILGSPPKPVSGLQHLQRFPKHIDVKTLKARIPEAVFNSYYKFSFVRNPWDMQVSLFHYGKRAITTHQYRFYQTFRTFDEYMIWRLKTGQRSQKSFLTDSEDRIAVDFVGKFENLKADFDNVLKRLDIRTDLPFINASERKPYQEYYTPATRDAVGEMFEEDIKQFDYRFE